MLTWSKSLEFCDVRQAETFEKQKKILATEPL